ncbi:MAG: nucleotide exchange factor GrpE [Magnetococcales bacterium]|nr:nucleotide exchange factor GrpE [Magnetococcales bacterium]
MTDPNQTNGIKENHPFQAEVPVDGEGFSARTDHEGDSLPGEEESEAGAVPGESPSLPGEVDRLVGRVEELETALAASRDETLRSLADMQNLRRRTAREVQQARDFAVEGFARDLLPVADNMERALSAMPEREDPALKAMAEGIRLVQAELDRVFKHHGVTRIEAVGKPFDPNLHQAVQQVAVSAADSTPPGAVVSELQSGYLLNGRLLRASMVVVAKD